MKTKVLIYGANGYTGKLLTAFCKKHDIDTVVAGRSERLKSWSEISGFEYRIFSLSESSLSISQHLSDIKVLANMASPFSQTNQPLVKACIETGTHYIDLSSEITDFESIYTYSDSAKESGVMIMPGVGFGIVPTDVMAVFLKQKLPKAHKLTLAYLTEGGISRGTLRAVMKNLHRAGVIRENGKLIEALPASRHFKFKAFGKEIKTVLNPWRADVFTAFLSTGITDIETYSQFPKSLIFAMKKGKLLKPFINSKLMENYIDSQPEGPSNTQLKDGKTMVYGCIQDNKGHQVRGLLSGPESYLFSAMSTIEVLKRILADDFVAGFQTPAGLYGIEILSNLKNVKLQILA